MGKMRRIIKIGILGAAGAGKTTIARELVKILRGKGIRTANILPFAGPLKEGLAAMGFLDGYGDEPDAKGAPLPGIGKSPRYLMQTLGTEWGRQMVHPDIWVHLWKKRVEKLAGEGLEAVVADDVRFLNEISALDLCYRAIGGTGNGVIDRKHISEQMPAEADKFITICAGAPAVACAADEVVELVNRANRPV